MDYSRSVAYLYALEWILAAVGTTSPCPLLPAAFFLPVSSRSKSGGMCRCALLPFFGAFLSRSTSDQK